MKRNKTTSDGMRPEYDFSKGVRGKYAARVARGTNIVALEPDVASVFRDDRSVNEALRTLIVLSRPEAASAR